MVVMESDNNIEVRIEDDKGYIILSDTFSNKDIRYFRKAFENLERKNIKEFFIDMKDVSQIDSSGVGILVVSLRKTKEKGGKLRLMFPKDEVKRILQLVNIYSYFDIIE
jgi:anti-anti-sigma factor